MLIYLRNEYSFGNIKCHIIIKVSQFRLPQLNTWEITFTSTDKEISTWLTGTSFEFQGNNEDVYMWIKWER